jgi:hypothetical protein
MVWFSRVQAHASLGLAEACLLTLVIWPDLSQHYHATTIPLDLTI